MRTWLILALVLPGVAAAQDRAATLADIQAQLSTLSRQIDGLQAELSPSAPADATPAPIPGSVLERLDAVEAEVRRLTGQTEALAFRIERVVRDGTTRIGDLQFRLTELEGGDLGSVGPARPLGGQEGLDAAPPPPPPAPAPELAVGERAAFDAAQAALETGEAGAAAMAFSAFLQDYPRSPLSAAAHLGRGRALATSGDTAAAGRAYLEAFTLAETTDTTIASAGLLGRGQSLASLGQTREACLTLGQVRARFPDSPAAEAAQSVLGAQECP